MRQKILAVGIMLGFIVACSDDPITQPTALPATVAFTSESKLTVKENDPTVIELPVKLSHAEENPVTVTLEFIGEQVVNGSDFILLSENPLVIPAGSLESKVSLQINDNAVVQPETRGIYVRIRSVDPSKVKAAVPKEVVITIEEDDCPISAPLVTVWIGDLSIQNENDLSQAMGEESPSGLCSGKIQVTGNFVGESNPESTLSIELEKLTGPEGTAKITRTKLFDFTSQYEFEAEGTYNESTKKITLEYSFYDLSNSANNFSSTLVVTAL